MLECVRFVLDPLRQIFPKKGKKMFAAWLPATILGIAIWPFFLAVGLFIYWWVFLTFEPAYTREYRSEYYEYNEYNRSWIWGIAGTALTVWFFYTLMGELSWDSFKEFYPWFLVRAAYWLTFGFAWAFLLRWPIEAWRGTKYWDVNAQLLASKKYKGDLGQLTEVDRYDLNSILPKARKYKWRFLRWALLWPMSFLDTFFRDLLKIFWEWIYGAVSKVLDKMAIAIYGGRYVASKPADYDTVKEAEKEAAAKKELEDEQYRRDRMMRR